MNVPCVSSSVPEARGAPAPSHAAQRIRTKLDEIAADPYGGHPNATRLRGADRDFRIRVGDWRVIYSLDDEQSVLLVARIDQRGQVYR